MNLLILTAEDMVSPDYYRVAGLRHSHLRTVLKLHEGDSVKVGLLDGPRGVGSIVSIDDRELTLTLGPMSDEGRPERDIDIICAVPRPKILRKVLFVCAMFGVRSLHLVRANRTDKSYLLSPLMHAENQRKYLLDGLSQGEWTRLPRVELHRLFRPFCEDFLPSLPDFAHCPKLLADLGEQRQIRAEQINISSGPLLLAIGPEGGWVDFERELLARQRFTPVSLGSANLRVEFALTAALAQINLLAGAG